MQEKSQKPPFARPQTQAGRSGYRRLFTRLVLIGAGVIVVIGVILYAILPRFSVHPPMTTPTIGVVVFPNIKAGHQEGKLTYDQTPPVGGIHNPVWQNCGVYTTPIANENGVHSLEHGAVWITYRPDLPAAEVTHLQVLTRQSGYRLLSPYPGLPAPIVASAWGYQLKLERADDPALLRFLQQYEQNPQGPEPGAPCSGGLGQPN